MNDFMLSVKETHVPSGSAVLWWLGQMGLLVKMGKTVFCLDYYASDSPARQVPPPVPADAVEGVDCFLGSHDHEDHIDHPAWRIWAQTCPDAVFVYPRIHRESVAADGINEKKGIGLTEGESIQVGEVKIHAIAAAHEFLDQDPQTRLYPHLQYILEGIGLRIYYAGDTLRYEGMLGKLKAFGPIDAALLPINGRDALRYSRNCIGNMTFQEAADLAGELQTGLAIPGHWDMFADNSADPQAFKDYLELKYKGTVQVKIPQYLEPIYLTKK